MFYTPYRGFKGSSSLSWSSLGNQPYKNFLGKADWPSLRIAIFHGSREAAKLAAEKGKFNEGLHEAAQGGHKDLVDFSFPRALRTGRGGCGVRREEATRTLSTFSFPMELQTGTLGCVLRPKEATRTLSIFFKAKMS